MSISYECDRCHKQSRGGFYETKNREEQNIHLCDDCYIARKEMDKEFMKNKYLTISDK